MSHERRGVSGRVFVTVPTAVRPLPVQQPVSEVLGRSVVEPEPDDRQQRTALLGGAPAVPTLEEGYAEVTDPLGGCPSPHLDIDLELRREPGAADRIAQGFQRRIASRVAEGSADSVRSLRLSSCRPHDREPCFCSGQGPSLSWRPPAGEPATCSWGNGV